MVSNSSGIAAGEEPVSPSAQGRITSVETVSASFASAGANSNVHEDIVNREVNGRATFGEEYLMHSVSRPQSMWCENVTYQIGEKIILDDVTAIFPAGQLTAIMGPSGSGKTSLINCLLQRVNSGCMANVCGSQFGQAPPTLEGRFGCNNQEITTALARFNIFLVPSDIYPHEYLTVDESLRSTAALRLPFASQEEQVAVVDKVIEWLQLEDCRSTLIGGLWRKGISKGQMKRFAIANELLGSPNVLVLDEPTSGLDAALTLELLAMLRFIARTTHKAVVCSIHQPSQKAFDLFDHLLLLSQGKVLYQGKPNESLQFLRSVGRLDHTETRSLCAPDYLLEVASPFEEDQPVDWGAKNLTNLSSKDQLEKLAREYGSSSFLSEVQAQIRESQGRMGPGTENQERFLAAQTWGTQWRIICKRQMLQNLRNPLTLFLILLLNIVQAMILGVILWQLDSDMKTVQTSRYDKWPIWDSPALIYFTSGLDQIETNKTLYDPLRDFLEAGEDNAGTSMVFDIMASQDMVDYIGDVANCTKTLLPGFKDLKYPNSYWPDGSILQSQDFVLKNPQVDPDNFTLGVMTLEKSISTAITLLQSFDLAIKFSEKQVPGFTSSIPLIEKSIPSIIGDGDGRGHLLWFADAVATLGVYKDVMPCCLGMEFGIPVLTLTRCESLFPDAKLPVFPGRVQWTETWSTFMRAFESNGRRLLDAYREVQVNNIKTRDMGSPNFDTDKLNTFARTRRHPGAHKRRLGASLGGLVTDLWAILFDDPSNPLYPIAQSIRSMYQTLKSDLCTSPYCGPIQSMLNTGMAAIKDFANTFLTLVNIGGAIFFLAANLSFSSYDVLLQVPKDRPAFNRERAAGLFSTSSYLLGRMVAEMIFQVVPGLVWAIIYWIFIGMPATPGVIAKYCITVVLTSFCSYSLGYMISALSPRLEIAIVFSPLLLVVMLTLAGFFLRDPMIPIWLRWFRYFSVYRWSFFAILNILFPPGGAFGPLPNALCALVLGVTENRLWVCCLNLLALGVGFRILAYIGMKFCYKHVGLEA